MAALNEPDTDLFLELRRAVLQPPAASQALDPERSPEYRLDPTHPPIAYRIRFLQTRAAAPPKLLLSSSDAEELERELRELAPAVQKALVEQYRRRLYR